MVDIDVIDVAFTLQTISLLLAILTGDALRSAISIDSI